MGGKVTSLAGWTPKFSRWARDYHDGQASAREAANRGESPDTYLDVVCAESLRKLDSAEKAFEAMRAALCCLRDDTIGPNSPLLSNVLAQAEKALPAE